MSQFAQVAIASRAFSLAAILGLSLAFTNSVAVQATVVVSAIAALASYSSTTAVVPIHWVLSVEAGIAGLVVVLALPDSVLLLPYLVVLSLLAGLDGGILGAALVSTTQFLALLTLSLTSGALGASAQTELLAPWSLAIAGAGLLGAWGKKLGRSPAQPSDETYEAARRLLGQLRTLARQLSSGLDPIAISHQMLALASRSAPGNAAIFVRTDGGMLMPLAFQGASAREALDPTDPAVAQCLATGLRTDEGASATDAQHSAIRAFPLRVGTGMVGVLVTDCTTELADAAMEELQIALDELSLRLDTALTFDEVRTLVTAEERQRLAREIHDGIAQEVASLGYTVDDISAMTADPDLVTSLKSLRSELSRVVTELRHSIFDLRTEVGDGVGLGSALSEYVRRVGAQSPFAVHLTLNEAPTRLTPAVEMELLRIAQEAITNARKHSEARNVWVDCQVRPPCAVIEVRDDGRGLGLQRADSFGLRIMQERAERIDGHLLVATGDAGAERPGTCVRISVGDGFQPRTEPRAAR